MNYKFLLVPLWELHDARKLHAYKQLNLKIYIDLFYEYFKHPNFSIIVYDGYWDNKNFEVTKLIELNDWDDFSLYLISIYQLDTKRDE